jgi:hypothetical protein
MTAFAALYFKDCERMKNGIAAHLCVVSPEYRCSNEPALPLDCAVAEDGYMWCFVRTYVPLVHDTARLGIFDDSLDVYVFLEDVPALSTRLMGATHVVKFVPLRMKQVPFQMDDGVALIWIAWEIKAPLFFYAALREKDTPAEHLELQTANNTG